MDVNSRDPLQNIIPFRIKGVEISRFDSSGNLKIGTTTTTAPTVRLDISGGSARVNSGSATSTALTTTGWIGVNMATPGADLDVSGVARMAALSATSTALTTTGRIGVNTAAPTVDLDVSGVVRMAALSATSTALTTTGRIGVNMAAPTVALDVTGEVRISSNLNMTNTRVYNLNGPALATDAATKGYVDGEITSARALSTAAQSTANTAVTNAATAQSTANTAVTNAATAQSTANTVTTATTARSATAAARWLYPGDGADAGIVTNTEWRLLVKPDGNIGISNNRAFLTGSGNINFPLHVFGNSSGQLNTILPTQMNINTTSLAPFAVSIRNISICAQDGDVAALNFAAYSDKRIKKNIHPLQPNKCVEMIRDLSPVSYKYIDYITNSSCSMYGFIAQDVKKHIPDAISYKTDYIPNLYSQVKLSKYSDESINTDTAALWKVTLITSYTETGIFTFCPNKDNSGNEYVSAEGSPLSDSLGNQKFKIKFITYDSSGGKNELICYTHKLINDREFVIDETSINNEFSSETTNKYSFEEKEYILYGQEVPDFHILTYDYLWSVFAASLKEVDRQQQADKARIAELEATVASQQSLINDILERLKTNGM